MTDTLTKAARDVLAERERHVTQEGWTSEHDDEHNKGEMAHAAACYAIGARVKYHSRFVTRGPNRHAYQPSEMWPWDVKWWKPSDYRRNLVKAGALILAEIERLDRMEG